MRYVADLEDVRWPTDRIETERLCLRAPIAGDRDGYIELLSSEAVRRYLGGPRCSREYAAKHLPAVPTSRAGEFAVESTGTFVGTVNIDRRDPERPGHVRAEGNEIEVSYTFLPLHWGKGYATEAVEAAIAWAETACAGEPIVACTQMANTASVRVATRVGFREQARFVEFDAIQWLGVLASARNESQP